MSDSEGDFESADEDSVVPEPAASAEKPATAPTAEPPVVTNQPPTAADADAANPAVELSFGGSGGAEGGGGGGSWTSWGISWGQSLISGAKSGVTVLAKELGDGIGTVSRTVESVLDAPSPEDMAGGGGGVGETATAAGEAATAEAGAAAAGNAPIAAATAPDDSSSAASGGGGGNWFTGWRVGGSLTSSVTQTGSYLVSGGLDLLESLGKRTMDALQETDPGFQRTKALLRRGGRPNLTELLREAQASGAAAAAAAGAADGSGEEADSPDFACQFDRLNGSAYLDGLQTLAGQCELRLQAKLSTRPDMRPAVADILTRLERVRGEDDDGGGGGGGESASEKPATLDAALAKLPAQYAQANAWLTGAVAEYLHADDGDGSQPEKMGVAAMQVDCVRRLAGLTAATLHYLVKAASLASAAGGGGGGGTESASRLADLCFALIGCADRIRERACASMQEAAAAAAPGEVDEHEVNQAMTQAILEAEGSKAYLQDAFLLLAPVLQLAALDEPTVSSQ